MSRIDIKIPEVGQTTSEVTLLKWHKQVGASVQRGDVLAELETDKMVVEMESFAQGTLVELIAGEGSTVAVGTVVAILESKQKAASKSPSATPDKSQAGEPASVPATPDVMNTKSGTLNITPVNKPKASPAAKALAAELGVSLDQVRGSGPDGLIIRRNVTEARTSDGPGKEPSPLPHGTGDLLDRHRLATGRAMSQSKREMPHFYLEMEVRADALEADRARRNQQGQNQDAKITVTDYLIAACARAIKEYPRFNAMFTGEQILPHTEINMGLAVSAPQGLVLPALRQADRLSLVEIAKARRALIERIWEGKADAIQPTFTISNLGMVGITRFVAIIPPKQAAILAVGAIQKRLVLEGDMIRNISFMCLTLSLDHRVADGAEGAQFLARIRELLEKQVATF